MQDFEKLGAFYLGKRFNQEADSLTDELILYDSGDLTTHAVIIGMTGSGKTGLGIDLIEEAAIDHIPVIAIDPKGDMGNILLTFPELRPADFEPWVDTRAATESGQSVPEFARSTAALWKNGLAEWGQDASRIEKLRAAADLAIYTPGSTAGLPVSVLAEFSAPSEAVMADADAYREYVQSTATGILTLLEIDADPVTSREHILVANVLDTSWKQGVSLDLASLIGAVQSPPFERIGVMDLDTFYPAKDRFRLAMSLNNLLAAPGFEAWMTGAPLKMPELLFTESGQPRVSVMSIAHLSDAERMFFVTMLLSELITWMRAQPGSGSLRAILYMDEIFGYMPPVANPPSKRLFLTLLKQARAYGVGLVLATQNPVDLDYKGLSNTGTWFIGRLQTERDKARVREGLRGAASSENLEAQDLEATLSGLGKRRFLLHNVHEKAPVIFQTRWAMSYLAGPMTRDQIKLLMADRVAAAGSDAPPVPERAASEVSKAQPLLPPGIRQFFVPRTGVAASGNAVYRPVVLAAGNTRYTSARMNIDEQRPFMFSLDADGVDVNVDWSNAEVLELDIDDLSSDPLPAASFETCPSALSKVKNFTGWGRQLKRWIRLENPVVLYKSPKLKVSSELGESERDFRVRLQQLGNEERDRLVAKLRKRYQTKFTRLENRLQRAAQAVEREEEQARGSKMDTAISFGTAILGAVLGRKKVSVTSASRVGTAVRKAGRMGKQSGDVKRARQTVESVQEELAELQTAFDDEVAELEDAYDAQSEELKDVSVRAKAADIEVSVIGVGWVPY